jgi:hypothetical protein
MELSVLLFAGMGLLGAAFSRQLTDEFKAWTPWFIERAVRLAIDRLPQELRERFGEEWRSVINDTPGEIGKILVAFGLRLAAAQISMESAQESREENVPLEVLKKDFTELFTNGNIPLRQLAIKWRQSFGHFDPSVISLAVRNELLATLVIVGIRSEGAKPIWRFIGTGYECLGKEWCRDAIGENTDAFGIREWVSDLCASVAATGQPHYDLITDYFVVGRTAYI